MEGRISKKEIVCAYTVSGVTVLTITEEQSPALFARDCVCPGWVPVIARRQLSAIHPGGALSKRGVHAKIIEANAKTEKRKENDNIFLA